MKLTAKLSVAMIYFNSLLNNRANDNLIDCWLQTAHENVDAHHKNCNITLKEGRMRKTLEFTVKSFWQWLKYTLNFSVHSSKRGITLDCPQTFLLKENKTQQ